MQTVLNLISPAGRTSRTTYWWFTAFFVFFIIAMGLSRTILSQEAMTAAFALVAVIFVLLTIRRLHDAGWSRLWVLPGLIPFSFFSGFEPIQLVGFSVGLPDVSALIRSAPFILALALPSAEIRGEQKTDEALPVGKTALA